ADRRDGPLCDDRSRRGSDHRAGSGARGPHPDGRRAGEHRRRPGERGAQSGREVACGAPRVHQWQQDRGAEVTAKIIDGKAIAKKLRAEYHARVDALRSRHNVTPALAVILVGDNPASQSYVRNKIAGCKEVGIRSELVELPASTTEEQLLDHIERLNDDVTVHGILVQLPLPAHIRVSSVLEKIS